MNPRVFFYKDYYTSSIPGQRPGSSETFDLKKPVNKGEFKSVKKYNAPIIAAANRQLEKFELARADYNSLKLDIAPDIITKTTTYPGLLIGTGYTHQSDNEGEYKLGFYFDYTCGIPCIPGSSVKGTLRSVFPQLGPHPCKLPRNEDRSLKLSSLQQSKTEFIAGLLGWNTADLESCTLKVHQLELVLFEGVDLERSQQPEQAPEYLSVYKRCIFHHAFISRAPGNTLFATDTITPHNENPLKDPTPLNFLKIKPGVEFSFQLVLRAIPALGLDKDAIKNLFSSILDTTGIGAKTNVGYGQF
ncbi:MAG: type III-B CRISPR module RAMP protein Cmr6 [Ferruginibacter sp.]